MQRAMVSAAPIGSAKRFNDGIGPDRFDRFGDPAGRLVKTPAECSAEAQCQGRARLSEQVADLVEAKHPEALELRGRKSQGRNRQRRDIVRCFPGLGHKACPPAETRQGVGRASAVAARARKPTPASSSTSVASITGSPPWR